jgi:hypothetical protein
MIAILPGHHSFLLDDLNGFCTKILAIVTTRQCIHFIQEKNTTLAFSIIAFTLGAVWPINSPIRSPW